MIETRLLRYFLTVAKEQNITNAAKALDITQPTYGQCGPDQTLYGWRTDGYWSSAGACGDGAV